MGRISGTQESIALTDITVEEGFNVRESIGDIDDLTDSIRATGLQTPIGVQARRGGGYKLVYGFRRFAALLAIGDILEVPAVVYKTTKKADVYLLNLQENAARENLNPMEEAVGAQRLIDEGMKPDEVREALAWTKTTLTQRLNLLAYSDDLKTAVAEDKVTVRQAGIIAQLPDDKQSRFIDMAEAMTSTKLREAVDKEIERIQSSNNPELAGAEDGDGASQTADGADGEDGASSPAAKVDPSQVAQSVQMAAADLVFWAYQNEEDEEKAAEAFMEIRRIDFTALPVADLERFEGVLSNLSIHLGAEGSADAAMGGDEEKPEE